MLDGSWRVPGASSKEDENNGPKLGAGWSKPRSCLLWALLPVRASQYANQSFLLVLGVTKVPLLANDDILGNGMRGNRPERDCGDCKKIRRRCRGGSMQCCMVFPANEAPDIGCRYWLIELIVCQRVVERRHAR